MTDLSLILDTDSYKHSHYRQYPPGTEAVSSYVEARAGGAFPEAVFFGLQSYLKNTLGQRVTTADVDEAARVTKAHGVPFNEAGWRHIAERGGALPLEISAAPEGTVLPEGNVMVQVVNTDPACAWLTSFVETALLRAVWYPTTVATVSWRIRRLISAAFDAAGDAPDGVLDFMLNDFGARGVSSQQSAALGGMAHLLSFDGTDNMAGLMAATRDYGAAVTAQSVPAAEHSTITAWGRDGEEDAYRNMMTAFPGYPIISVVSDSYDLDRAVTEMWGGSLKPPVEASGSRLVVRPDSGDPATIVVRTVSQLMDAYGHETTPQGLRVLPDHVRVIQGDGVEEASIGAILDAMRAAGLAPWNVVFGMGGGALAEGGPGYVALRDEGERDPPRWLLVRHPEEARHRHDQGVQAGAAGAGPRGGWVRHRAARGAGGRRGRAASRLAGRRPVGGRGRGGRSSAGCADAEGCAACLPPAAPGHSVEARRARASGAGRLVCSGESAMKSTLAALAGACIFVLPAAHAAVGVITELSVAVDDVPPLSGAQADGILQLVGLSVGATVTGDVTVDPGVRGSGDSAEEGFISGEAELRLGNADTEILFLSVFSDFDGFTQFPERFGFTT